MNLIEISKVDICLQKFPHFVSKLVSNVDTIFIELTVHIKKA